MRAKSWFARLSPALALAASLSRGARSANAADAGKGASAPQCATGEQNALDSIACGIEKQLNVPPTQTTIVATTPKADVPLKDPAALSSRLANAIATGLGQGVTVVPGATTLLAAQAGAPDTLQFVVIDTVLTGGRIVVNAEVRSALFGFWDRVRGMRVERRPPVSYFDRVDGELSRFLTVPPVVATKIDKMPAPASDIVALACGDTDGEPSPELYVVSRHRIDRGRVPGLFESLAETAWTALTPVAPSPLREPICTAEVAPSGFLRVASTDRAEALTLTRSLTPDERVGGVFPVRYAGCLSRKGVALGSQAACRNEGPPLIDLGGAAVDAIASGVSVSATGQRRRVVAFRSPDGVATLKDDSNRVTSIPDVGAALAVADLDRDGVPEVVASENTENPATDAVVVRSFREDGSVVEVLRVPVPEGVRAIATCPPDSFAMSAIVVATRTSLWVIR